MILNPTMMPHPLSGPYDKKPSPDGIHVNEATGRLVKNQVRALLESSPAFYQLPVESRRELARNLNKVASYSAALVQEDWAQSKRLGQTPVLKKQTLMVMPEDNKANNGKDVKKTGSGNTPPISESLANSQPAAPVTSSPLAKNQDTFQPRAANQVARITEETLNAVAFPTFVADLIKGTFQAVVDASIQQMEAYGKLLSNVAKTVDQFMADNITDNQARDWLAQTYPAHFKVDVSEDSARVAVRDGADDRARPDFRSEFGLQEEVDLDDDTAEEILVPAARRRLAQNRHQMLSTMVLFGINRIVVTSGKIKAQMGFRINAQDSATAESASQFDAKNETTASYGGGLAGFLGGPSVKTRNTISYVSSSKRASSDDLDVNASLTGEVELKFKSDYFPLDRLSTPEMLATIQGNTPNPSANAPNTAGIGDKPE